MATNNSLNLSLKTQTGTGKFVGDTSASVTDLLVNGSAPIVSIVEQIITSSGTYTPNAAMVFCVVEAIGGGGGGGGCAAAAALQVCVGGSGAGGAYCKSLYERSVIDGNAPITVTIGGGGLAGAPGNNSGGNGDDTLFGTLLSAGGGTGGAGGASVVLTIVSPGDGGFPADGDINIWGESSGLGIGITSVASSGSGGNSFYGTGGSGVAGSNAGNDAPSYPVGCGGGGSGAAVNAGGTSKSGGYGSAGLVIITEYCSQ